MILVTGANGFLGKRVCRQLEILGRVFSKTSLGLGVDLLSKKETFDLFESVKPVYLINCAAHVGGIAYGLESPAQLFKDNLEMGINLFEAAHKFNIKRFVNPISNCVYPAQSTYFKEEELWDGKPHESVLAYAMAKKTMLVGAWAYQQQYNLDTISIILSNMYGPEDHFDPHRSHALGALIKKIVEAKENRTSFVDIWGTGKPVREWLFVDDAVQALIKGLDADSYGDPINIGVGQGVSVLDLAQTIKEVVGIITFSP